MRVAILDDFNHWAQRFAPWGDAASLEFQFFSDHLTDLDQLAERLAEFDGIGVMRERTPFPAALIERLPKLRCLVTTGMANAAIDLQACQRQGIVVSGTESPGHATAELAFLLILAQFRRLIPLIKGHQAGQWQTELGQDCRGKTLGIVGLGRLGSQLAILGRAIGMRVIAWSPNLTPERCAPHQVGYVSKENVFREADVVSIHMKLSERTRHLIGREELDALGPTSFLVNTSRADLVDPQAMLHALDHGLIRGYATDVYDIEPTSQHDRLVHHHRTLCTPHIGYCTEETFQVFYAQMLEAFEAFQAGTPVRILT
jgi:phosphoglycerate dehydrogenase-like enzyme